MTCTEETIADMNSLDINQVAIVVIDDIKHIIQLGNTEVRVRFVPRVNDKEVVMVPQFHSFLYGNRNRDICPIEAVVKGQMTGIKAP